MKLLLPKVTGKVFKNFDFKFISVKEYYRRMTKFPIKEILKFTKSIHKDIIFSKVHLYLRYEIKK